MGDGCELLPVKAQSQSKRPGAHGPKEVRRQDAAICVVAIPGELVQQILCVGLYVPVVIRFIAEPKIGDGVATNHALWGALPTAATLTFIKRF